MIAMTLQEVSGALGIDPPMAGAARFRVVAGVSTDSRTVGPNCLFFAIRGERFDGHDFVRQAFDRGACACVVERNPGVGEGPLLLVDGATAALDRLARFDRRRQRAKLIAVTGSNGKTTTKNMLERVLAERFRVRAATASYNNHIGVPLTLLSCEANDEVLIVEIGSNAPGEVGTLAAMAAPDIGVLTSVGYAHLAGFGGLDGVRAEKMSLFDHVRTGGVAVVNVESVAGTAAGAGRLPRSDDDLQWITFGERDDADIRVGDIQSDLRGTRATIHEREPSRETFALNLAVVGRHNAVNAAGVWSVCRRFGMAPGEILDALASFEAPDMRMGVHRYGDLTVIDDCYNANPSSVIAAIDVLRTADRRSGRRVLVAGDMAELGASSRSMHRRVGREVAQAGVDMLVTVGAEAQQIAEAARDAGFSIETVSFADAEEASRKLPDRLRLGDTVLVKGSRAVGLERLVSSIGSRFGGEPGEPVRQESE